MKNNIFFKIFSACKISIKPCKCKAKWNPIYRKRIFHMGIRITNWYHWRRFQKNIFHQIWIIENCQNISWKRSQSIWICSLYRFKWSKGGINTYEWISWFGWKTNKVSIFKKKYTKPFWHIRRCLLMHWSPGCEKLGLSQGFHWVSLPLFRSGSWVLWSRFLLGFKKRVRTGSNVSLIKYLCFLFSIIELLWLYPNEV